MRFPQIFELLQHSGSYCKDMYIAQTELDNIIYMLHVRTSVQFLSIFHLQHVLFLFRLFKPVSETLDAEGELFPVRIFQHTCVVNPVNLRP